MKLLLYAILIAKLFANPTINWIFAIVAIFLLAALAIYVMNRTTLSTILHGIVYLLLGFMLCIFFLFFIGLI